MDLRLKKFKQAPKAKKLDGFIVTNHFNIYYLTGFRGILPTEREAILVTMPKYSTLITARLYQTEAKKLASSQLKIKIAGERNEINHLIKELLVEVKNVGFEEHDLKFSEFKEFKRLLKGKKLVAVKHLVEDLRIIKEQDEINNIQNAQIISQKAFDQILKTLNPGQTEAEIADTLIKIIKNLGADGLAFEPIVASGKNSAKPHHITGNRRLAINDTLLFDFGAKLNNYCSDLSRTVFIGRTSDEQRNIYHHVRTAQNMAIAKIGVGVKVKHAHNSVNKHFKKQNLEQYFLHSLGHGIGLETHEKPSISRKSKDTLAEGMVFSVEPGLYFPAWGGVRIEDLVTIKNGRAKILGKSAGFIRILQK